MSPLPPQPPAVVCPDLSTVSLDRVLSCIRQVEERRNHPLGAHGERSPWQFTRETWESTTSLPWDAALDEQTAYCVAREHLLKLKWEMRERRIEPTAYRLFLGWNGGIGAVILGKFQNKDVIDYAVRCENLFYDR
jgi:hypothetical protein